MRNFDTISLGKVCLLLLLVPMLLSCKKETAQKEKEGELTEKNGSAQAEFWLTDPSNSVLFKQQTAALRFGEIAGQHPTITVDTTETFQTMDGFGYTLTGGSAMLLRRMSAADRASLLQELFSTTATS